MRRATLARSISLSGVGLFSAQRGTLRLMPAPSGSGICFLRPGQARPTPATIAHLSTLPAHTGVPAAIPGRNTTLADAPDAPRGFATVEHLLSALAGLGVHDAAVELDGPEVPIFDGSAEAFVRAIREAGVRHHPLGSPVHEITLQREVVVRDERSGASVRATPRAAPGASWSYTLSYGAGSPIPAQTARFEPGQDYAAIVAPARTFCLDTEARAMQALGLFTHLSTRDMLVLDARGEPIDNALRFPDEPARHKLLDLIGDLALLGAPLRADVTADRSGHALTHALVREILAAARAHR